MLFSLIVILLVAAVAYFHYTQGLFSATLSAVLAVLASVLAVGYHQRLAALLLGGRMADYAPAFTLVAIFAGVYLLGRIAFDRFVPGNLRLNNLIDKLGGGVMGFIAAAFGVGLFAVAAQSLPLPPNIAMYGRYETRDRTGFAINAGGRRLQDAVMPAELVPDTFEDAPTQRMILPVDDWVIGLTEHLSDGGSLAGRARMGDVHPAFLNELYAHRLGLPPGVRRSAMNVPARQQVEVEGVFRLNASVPQVSGELTQVRPAPDQPRLSIENDETLLVVRVAIDSTAADTDNFVRVTPAGARLVVGQTSSRRNVFPIGTLENGRVLVRNRPDDVLLVATTGDGGAVDFVYRLPTRDVLAGDPPTILGGTLLEIKRLARLDLSGQAIEPRVTPSTQVSVLRKVDVQSALNALGAASTPAAVPPGE